MRLESVAMSDGQFDAVVGDQLPVECTHRLDCVRGVDAMVNVCGSFGRNHLTSK